MITSLKIENYQDLVECKSPLYQSKESFLKCNCEFFAGNTYGVVSDFGYGSWGLVTALTRRGTQNHSGTVFLNGKEIHFDKLLKYSCFISEKYFPDVNTADNLLTPKDCIEKALNISGQNYSVQKIKKIFCLTDNRFERCLEDVGSEIWLISAAVNFALGKDIFCYPWLNESDISWFEIACKCGVTDFLKDKKKIILIPSSQEKKIKRLCDHTLKFYNGKFSFR